MCDAPPWWWWLLLLGLLSERQPVRRLSKRCARQVLALLAAPFVLLGALICGVIAWDWATRGGDTRALVGFVIGLVPWAVGLGLAAYLVVRVRERWQVTALAVPPRVARRSGP